MSGQSFPEIRESKSTMRVTYHVEALQNVNLKAYCEDIDFVECNPVETFDELIGAVETSEVLMFNNPLYTKEFAQALASPKSNVRWIQLSSTGFDNLKEFGLPVGIEVTNAASIWAPIVAEHACALTLGILRGLHHAERNRAASLWDRPSLQPELNSLEGARVAILGFGTIGKELARRLKPFDTEIVAVVRRPGSYPFADEICLVHDVMSQLPTFDILISALPLSEDTLGIIDRGWFDLLPKSSFFVNIGRGGCVVQADLAYALEQGLISGAALDVTEVEPMPQDDPLWESDRLILTPHIATMGTRKSSRRALGLYRDNILRFYHGKELSHVVMTHTK